MKWRFTVYFEGDEQEVDSLRSEVAGAVEDYRDSERPTGECFVSEARPVFNKKPNNQNKVKE
jgi:hypothetical protein